MFRLKLILVLIVGGMLGGSPLGAAPTATFLYVTDQSTYETDAIVTVNVYLSELGVQPLIAKDGGLYGFGVRIERNSGESGASIVGFQSNVANLWSSNLTLQSDYQADSVYFGGSTDNFLGVATNVLPDSNGKILLGSINIQATSGTTQFSIKPYSEFYGTTITAGASQESLDAFGYFDLDSTDNAALFGNPSATYMGAGGVSTTFVVSFVPEPSSLILTAAIFGAAGVVARRRRQLSA